ncbi:LuxR C-terminal-related transcriptional regulator [Romeriopsis navalis]|uniref:LuxR C-terminal-related transcriptional regulator n=1 Tax=Romeriopsis navalis TaxID=2992132 RepID=UPI0021F87CEE|nr:LuxR C-terminal-related transcriptional regulator [Romeriopsis navalis]
MRHRSDDSNTLLNSARLLCDFQQVNKIGQSISGCFDPGVIAHRVTDALVEQFDCAFARMWLINPDQRSLTLVASSGLYTHLNGAFAQVPMGAYKVGKIAQNRVPFLSNCLPDETWVKDRDWAIANRIQGFAGYPLVAGDRVVGVLATFSHETMAPEFLEVLQLLCLTATIGLDAAIYIQQSRLLTSSPAAITTLSDQLARILQSTRLMLVGTEITLESATENVLRRATELLNQLNCDYCRLTYGREQVELEAIVATPNSAQNEAVQQAEFQALQLLVTYLGGMFQLQPGSQNRVLEILLQIPYQGQSLPPSKRMKPVIDNSVGQVTKPDIAPPHQPLSEREQEIMGLLSQGMRDRQISKQLHISESTVKFHINNTLTKLQAKNRYQALYEATKRDWI